MSERITWEPCPRCGGRAAVGWGSVTGSAGTAVEVPVEFDCSGGCELPAADLQRLLPGVEGEPRPHE